MLNEKYKHLLVTKSIFKSITVLGISIVILSGISLYKQTHMLDINEYNTSDKILFDLNDISEDTLSSKNLLDKKNSSNNTRLLELTEVSESTKRKASLLSVIYDERPNVNDNLGTMTIYDLDRVLPIFHGTNEKQLSQGIGHVETSVLPGENDNLVLAGHRETIFRELDKLELGDLILIQTDVGDFTYAIDNTRIVEDDDTTVIISTGYASLTLVTCYPFDYIGSAPQRYIVTATLIQSNTN